MRIEREQLVPTNVPLVRFRGTRVYPLDAVTLTVTMGNYPQQITKDVTFQVVNYSSTYNAILGRPTLNSWNAITSTDHLIIKFPIGYGVGEVQGDQVVARECYKAMLEMDNHLQTLSIKEQQIVAEPVDGLEEVPLDDSRPKQTTRIGTLTSPPIGQALTAFLRENQDVFS